MIPFRMQTEPETFDERCRVRGREWLTQNSDFDRPKDFWSEFEPDLRKAFRNLCGYCAMLIMKGDVDHFVPIALLKERGQLNRAYEWDNFRYGEGVLNRKKWKHEVLDPFLIEEGWFEVHLPSLQLRRTSRVPQHLRQLADFTLRQLGLRDGEVVVRYRREWFRMYQAGKLSLDGLKEVAPLIAEAVSRDLEAGKDWRDE